MPPPSKLSPTKQATPVPHNHISLSQQSRNRKKILLAILYHSKITRVVQYYHFFIYPSIYSSPSLLVVVNVIKLSSLFLHYHTDLNQTFPYPSFYDSSSSP
mmetsp:Transcript_24721/g.42087  ORF Transcript_24721/g.42087 Transcript_24721/m.42087 type:complete len:101 (-) Transcript_24721:389-691(-)